MLEEMMYGSMFHPLHENYIKIINRALNIRVIVMNGWPLPSPHQSIWLNEKDPITRTYTYNHELAFSSKYPHMEPVFFRLHVRFVRTITRLFPLSLRSVLETFLLITSVFLLLVFIMLHIQFVHPTATCLDQAISNAQIDIQSVDVLEIRVQSLYSRMSDEVMGLSEYQQSWYVPNSLQNSDLATIAENVKGKLSF